MTLYPYRARSRLTLCWQRPFDLSVELVSFSLKDNAIDQQMELEMRLLANYERRQ